MPIQYQGPLTASPNPTTVTGPVTFSVDILVTSSDVQVLDLDYIIVDPSSAVFFQSGGKIERRQEQVFSSQMRLVHPTQLICGSGVQDPLGAQFVLSISSNGVLQAQPIGCGVGITSYTCAPTIPPVMGGSVLSHALASVAFTGGPGGADTIDPESDSKATTRRASTRKRKSTGTTKRGGKK